MMRFATKKDVPQLKKLWIASFHDSNEYIDFFFQNMPGVECVVYEHQGTGQIISMLFLLKCSLNGYNGRYIFAACTQADFRGRGIMSQLLDFTVCSYQNTNNCDFLCLVPASETLFQYYANAGFKTYFYNTILTLDNNNKEHVVTNDLTYEMFTTLRSAHKGTVQWAAPVNEFVFKENLFNGGKNLKTPTGYVIMREAGDLCQVIEWHSLANNVNELSSFTRCGKIEVRKPCADHESKHPNGMIRILKDSLIDEFSKIKYPYLSLVLD